MWQIGLVFNCLLNDIHSSSHSCKLTHAYQPTHNTEGCQVYARSPLSSRDLYVRHCSQLGNFWDRFDRNDIYCFEHGRPYSAVVLHDIAMLVTFHFEKQTTNNEERQCIQFFSLRPLIACMHMYYKLQAV